MAMAEHVEALNALRAEASLAALEVDATAETVAGAHAASMCEHGFLSHWGLDGRNPYQRYAFGGVRSHVREVIHGESGAFGDDAAGRQERLAELCSAARDSVFKDANALAAGLHCTHVAFGVALTANEFRFVVAFVTTRVDLDEVSCPEELLAPELTLSGAVIPGREPMGPYCAVVYYDPPPEPMGAEELNSNFAGPYDDFSPEQLEVSWPWDFSFSAADGTFSAKLKVCGDLALRPGTYYVQLYLRGDVESIPYGEKADGVEVPGDGSVCATGVVLTVGEHLAAAGGAAKSDDGPGDLTLEEQAARHDALAASTKPDGAPATHLEMLHGVGALATPGEDFEKSVYMPVERAEQLTTANLGVAFKRLAPEELADDNDPLVVVDVCVAAGGEAPPPGFEAIEGFLLPPPNPMDDAYAATAPKLCVSKAPASTAGPRVLVDLAVVYGPKPGTRAAGAPPFDMGGGYETVPLPPAVADAYGAAIVVCVKREGAGRRAAEQLASDAALEAAAAMKAEDGDFDGDSIGGGFDPLDEDRDDEDDLLDTTLTPEQVVKLEEQRADRLREAEARADAEALERDALARREQLAAELASLAEQKAEQLGANAELQRRLAALLASTKRGEQAAGAPAKGGAPAADAAKEAAAAPAHEGEKQYSDALSAILDAKRRAAGMKDEYDRGAFDLQTRLDEKEFKAKKISDSFREFKHEIALSAENSRTSKPIPKRIIAQFEELELRREAEVEKVRLKNINLRMTLRKLEASLRAKEQLAEGLHLIDFEQLKIENQTLNEKIEERNEELHKLRKKNTANVQVLTHFKEKLQFVAAENDVVRAELATLDEELGSERDRVAKAKTERESLKADNAGLRQRQGFANNDLLVIDFEKRKSELQRVEQKIAELRERYSLLQAEVKKADAVTKAHAPE